MHIVRQGGIGVAALTGLLRPVVVSSDLATYIFSDCTRDDLPPSFVHAWAGQLWLSFAVFNDIASIAHAVS